MASHAPLLRTNTAPVFQQSTDGVARLQNMSMTTPRASQLSDSTAFTSTTSLTSLSSTTTVVAPPANGQVVATSNIINQKADASRSLYQICVSLKQRLATVPGFEDYLEQLAEWESQGGEENGPVESLWRLLRTGRPLLTIYNALQPEKPLEVDQTSASEEKRAKLATFKFVQACLKELHIPSTDMFVISDLTGNDTTGFVKVTSVVNYVLDLAQQKGLLLQGQPYPEDDAPTAQNSQMSYRDHIVEEMVNTERKYVQDLENLFDLKKTLDQRGVVPGDVVHDIFLNINAILDFQRRFLIRVETTNSMPPSRQEWGAPFAAYEDSFSIYQPFIANQKKATALAQQVFDKIQLTGHAVAVDFNTLDAFLLKPMQRLSRYPLLLKDLKKRSEEESTKADLESGIAAAERVLQKANEAVLRSELDEASGELMQRVDDWKNHRVEQFGKLLLHGTHSVITGKSDQEKDYEIFLFQCILLCCKEVSGNKKDKKDKSRSTVPKAPLNRLSKLQLKGRIFMTNVTEVVSFSKPGSYTVQIWWKGDPGVESFIIRFQTEETMRKWAAGLDAQRKENAPQMAQSPDQTPPTFAWMQTQMGEVVNPYAQQDDDDDDDYTPPTTGYSALPQPTPAIAGTMSRNASSTSLRQRSATAESSVSLAGMARAPPPRIPLPQPPGPLSVQTQMGPPAYPSPGPRGGDSYFSPVAESPVSSRTSTTSGFFANSAGYPFPKTGTPQPTWGEDSNRYTAPAMPRAPSREGPSPINAYGMVVNGRNPRGPSLPVMASQQSIAQQQRSRSYSTPDIQNQQPARRTERGGSQGVPAVPGIPPHLHPTHERHDSTIPRSNTGSPRNDLPIRSNTQSPGVQRERLQQQSLNQFPAQPIFPRQATPVSGHGHSVTPAPLNINHEASRTVSPPLGTGTPAPMSTNPLVSPDIPVPTQLKVKVNCDTGNYVTLVVAFNITYQSLIDRIDAKLARFTSSSISKGSLKLQYRDEDGDFVMIESDDDIQIAFLEWREGVRNMYSGGVGEIELFCVGETS